MSRVSKRSAGVFDRERHGCGHRLPGQSQLAFVERLVTQSLFKIFNERWELGHSHRDAPEMLVSVVEKAHCPICLLMTRRNGRCFSIPRSRSIFIKYLTALHQLHKSLGLNLQIGKVALGSGSDPQCDSTFPRLKLKVVDDEAGLLRSVHV